MDQKATVSKEVYSTALVGIVYRKTIKEELRRVFKGALKAMPALIIGITSKTSPDSSKNLLDLLKDFVVKLRCHSK